LKREGVVLMMLLASAATSAVAQYQCGMARDLVVRAIENLQDGAERGNIENGLQLIKHAEQTCPTSGDAWYYKAIFEEQLAQLDAPGSRPEAIQRHEASIRAALNTAKQLGSDAMRDGLSPFKLAAPQDRQTAPGPVQQKWALVVGIGKFTGKVDALQYASKDARDFEAALKDAHIGRFPADHVTLLTDADATTSNIKAALNTIARKADKSDMVLVFIASHGTARGEDSVGNLNYIVTYDTKTANEDLLYGSALPMAEVSEVIRSRIRAQRTVVLLDTCHSEGGGKGLISEAAVSSSAMKTMRAGAGRVVIASSGQKQQSYESDDLENGVFTHFFIEGMKKQDGQMPLSAIFGYVAQEVPKTVKLEKKAQQTPVMFRSEDGEEIVLGISPATQSTASLMPARLEPVARSVLR
jgi:uncharacterized caspase-like protein